MPEQQESWVAAGARSMVAALDEAAALRPEPAEQPGVLWVDVPDYCQTRCADCPHCRGCGGSFSRGGPYGCICDSDDDYERD